MIDSSESPQPRISMAELQRLMRDPETPESMLREFFIEAPEASGPFHPGIVPNPERVEIDPAADAYEGAMMMGWASSLTRQRRQLAFRTRQLRRDKRPVLVAEGDSWFNFPILLEDVIDHLSADFSIWSVDAPGDTLQNMVIDNPEYMQALQSQKNKVSAFLFSGAGNDILGEDQTGAAVLPQILRKYQKDKPAEWYVGTRAFTNKLAFIEKCYSKVFSDVEAAFPKLPVICHSYDFAIPGGGPGDPRRPRYAAQDHWLGRPMREMLNITDPTLQREIVAMMITRLNALIAGLCGGNMPGGTFRNAWLTPTPRTLLQIGLWNDELHPTGQGYGMIADKFRAVLKQALPGIAAPEPELAMIAEAFTPATEEAFVCTDAGEGVEFESNLEALAKPVVDRTETTSYKASRQGARIDHIVVHYTTSRNIEGTITHFKTGAPRTSAHYIIGRDGKLVQMVPDNDTAWHAGSGAMNRRSIGIEHVAAPGDEITPAQGATSAALIGWLMAHYGIPRDNVLPHCCIKATSCCGDLYRGFGGGAGKSCAVQKAALDQWMTSQGIGADTVTVAAVCAPTVTATRSPQVASADQRQAMARHIVDFEARRDAQGRIAVHELPPDDGGGRYEVAGINERFHKEECDLLVALIRAGRHDEAEARVRAFVLRYTDKAAEWTSNPAIEFNLRDCMFNRGPGGAARILQHALGVTVDGAVGVITRGALAKAEASPVALLDRLRASREWYERVYARRNETSRFWRGLVNRWNKVRALAQDFLPATPFVTESHPVPQPEGRRVLQSLDMTPSPAGDNADSATASPDFIVPGISSRPFSDIGRDSPIADPGGMLVGWGALIRGVDRARFEVQVGSDNSLPAAFLEALVAHRAAVGRIQTNGLNYQGKHGAWTGTGFLVGPDILLTNNHVLNSPEVARNARVEFDFEISTEDLSRGIAEPDPNIQRRSYRLNPGRLFVTSPAENGGLDYTFVGVTIEPAEAPKPVPIWRAAFPVSNGEQAFVLHHPGGRGKRVSLDDVAVIDIQTDVVKYTSDTLPGSSGAPVFDRRGRLFALHHAGVSGTFSLGDGRVIDGMNEGIKMAAIAMDLEHRSSQPDEGDMARQVLDLFHGSDSMAGFFGNLGREVAIAPNASSTEVVHTGYGSSGADVDVGFLSLDWLEGGTPDPVQLREAARMIIDIGGDLWSLEGVSETTARAVLAEIAELFKHQMSMLVADPDAPPDQPQQVVIWNPYDMEIERATWPAGTARYWSLPTEGGTGIFTGPPPLFTLSARSSGFSAHLLPFRSSVSDAQQRFAIPLMIRAAVETGTDKDWLIGGNLAESMMGDGLDVARQAGFAPMAAFDPHDGGLVFLTRQDTGISQIFLPRGMTSLIGDSARFTIAGNRSVDEYADRFSAGAPVLARLSVSTGQKRAAPDSDDITRQIEALLAV